MTIKRPLHLIIVGFPDGDWGSDPDDQQSITGYCIMMWLGLRRNNMRVSHSSTEVEYGKSLANVSTEVI